VPTTIGAGGFPNTTSNPFRRTTISMFRVTYRGKPIEEPLAMLFDKRRPLPGYAKVFCDMLAEHVRKGFPLPRG